METLLTLDCSHTVYRITYSIELWTEDYRYNEVKDAVLQDWRGVSGHESLDNALKERIEWVFSE